MLASQLTPQEMRRESRQLIKNLSRRIARIEGLGSSTPQYAVIKYRELEKTLPNRLNKLSEKDLTTLYRDLKYINSLKSSTVKGAIQTQEKFEPIRKALEALSPDKSEKFWSIYGRLYEDTGGEIRDFKYELFYTNIDYIYGGHEVDKAVHDIIELYQETNEQLGSRATNEEFKILFTSKLQSLHK